MTGRPETYAIGEAGALLGLTRAQTQALVSRGELKTREVISDRSKRPRTVIDGRSLVRWANELVASQVAELIGCPLSGHHAYHCTCNPSRATISKYIREGRARTVDAIQWDPDSGADIQEARKLAAEALGEGARLYLPGRRGQRGGPELTREMLADRQWTRAGRLIVVLPRLKLPARRFGRGDYRVGRQAFRRWLEATELTMRGEMPPLVIP